MKKGKREPRIYHHREPGNQKGARQIECRALGGVGGGEHGADLPRCFPPGLPGAPNVVTLGIAGYKKTQQLLALAYFLSLGAEYDLIINLDGYNDIVLPITDNYSFGVNPFFPRAWNLRSLANRAKKS